MKYISLYILLFTLSGTALAHPDTTNNKNEEKHTNELKYNLNKDGSHYIKATFLNQTWVRWNESNPGTTVNSAPKQQTTDIGLRRTRLQLYGQLSEHVFFYTQFGMNNFNFLSQNSGNRKLQAFFHDALTEYNIFKNNNQLKIGAGLTIVNGLSRFTQPSIGTILTTDVPVFLQATVDQTDEFARKLSLYARGQLGKLDYRIAVSDPFPIQTNGQIVPNIAPEATFTTYGHTHQYSGMLIYNILDKEPHTTPYMAGTYLGDKKILNIEGGIIYQQKATWHLYNSDTTYNDMMLWSVAAYADMPLHHNKYAISAYTGYFLTDYGNNYIRNNGIMNPANGNTNPQTYNGAGNAYPMFGTGNSIYTQIGIRLPKELLGKNGTLLPYFSHRYSKYDKLQDPVNIIDAGVNWLINKHQSKISLNYQNRPIFRKNALGDISKSSTANTIWLQYQVSI
jgi:hypothetical protein